MGAPVVHYEITGKDGPALREFYGSLFGWDFDLQPAPRDVKFRYSCSGLAPVPVFHSRVGFRRR